MSDREPLATVVSGRKHSSFSGGDGDTTTVARYEYLCLDVNSPVLPRSGLLAPRLSRAGLPVSVSEFIPDVGTGIPDSPSDVPSQVVRSVPLLPTGHSATTDGARFFSRLNTTGGVTSIVLLILTVGTVQSCRAVNLDDDDAVSQSYSLAPLVPCGQRLSACSRLKGTVVVHKLKMESVADSSEYVVVGADSYLDTARESRRSRRA